MAVSPDDHYATIFRDDLLGDWFARQELTSAGGYFLLGHVLMARTGKPTLPAAFDPHWRVPLVPARPYTLKLVIRQPFGYRSSKCAWWSALVRSWYATKSNGFSN